MKIKIKPLAFLIILLFFGGIVATELTGIWNTEANKTPRKIEEGDFKGENKPEDIKGSFTFGEISKLYDIPSEDLAKAFSIDINQVENFKCKELEAIYENQEFEIGTNSVRMFVAFYKGIEFSTDEESYLPKTATDIIIKNGKPTEKQIEYLKTHTIN